MIIQFMQTAQVALPDRSVGGQRGSAVVANGAAASSASVGPSAGSAAREPSSLELQRAVNSANQSVVAAGSNLKFTVDSETDERIVRVVDSQTGDVIRQIPSKEMLAVSEAIDQFLQRGVLLKQKA